MQNISIDKFDLRILDAIQSNGRLTSAELADLVGLSASQCSRRRLALEEAGVIAGYPGLLSEGALGITITAFVEVSLAAHSGDRSEQFARLVAGLDEVQEAYALTGDIDYLLKLSVASLEELREILNSKLLAHESVAKIRSSIVLEKLKSTTRLPLKNLKLP